MTSMDSKYMLKQPLEFYELFDIAELSESSRSLFEPQLSQSKSMIFAVFSEYSYLFPITD